MSQEKIEVVRLSTEPHNGEDMVPIIREHSGYWDKFLGDGIMYFFGAPYDNPNHAFDAVISVLQMQEVMVQFNKSLTERNLPTRMIPWATNSRKSIVWPP